jgi:predicted nucleic-acid-binding protein
LYGADTNVLVRLLVSDDLEQQQAVRSRLESILASGDSVLVTHVVMAELAWVLESAYDYDRVAIASAVEAITETPPFEVEGRDVVLHALVMYQPGSADLSDYLVLAGCSARGALPLLTFDRKLAREPGCELP